MTFRSLHRRFNRHQCGVNIELMDPVEFASTATTVRPMLEHPSNQSGHTTRRLTTIAGNRFFYETISMHLYRERRWTARIRYRSEPLRGGRLNSLWVPLLCVLALVAVLVGLLMRGGPGETERAQHLTVYCAAGVRGPFEKIAKKYEEEYGVKVDLQFGGSNTLLNQIEVNKFDTADLFLAADQFYTDQAVERGLASEVLPVAHMRLVIVVPKGNPKQIQTLTDLLRDDVAVSLPSPDQAAVGNQTRKLLQQVPDGETNLWERLEEHVTRHGVFKPTVNDVANDAKIGAVDAAIIWDALASGPQYRNDLMAISVPELDREPTLIAISVLNSSRQPTAALKFARYLAARDRGLPLFEADGFRPIEGDLWVERPSITFYCGAVNRRSVEGVIEAFSRREGVDVNTIYDGCGILTSRMQTISDQQTDLGFPDVYMACDTYYLENVAHWFQEAANVSSTEIVIAVPKGSSKVTKLADLVEPGIRVAIGEPDQCTIGALTRRLLVKEGLYEQLKEKQKLPGEVVVEKSSSALLVPDLVTGHVDAAVAYVTDTRASRDDVDVLHIESALNQAVQPLSISKTSDHKYLVRRLYKRIVETPEAFESAGFEFRFGGPSTSIRVPTPNADTPLPAQSSRGDRRGTPDEDPGQERSEPAPLAGDDSE